MFVYQKAWFSTKNLRISDGNVCCEKISQIHKPSDLSSNICLNIIMISKPWFSCFLKIILISVSFVWLTDTWSIIFTPTTNKIQFVSDWDRARAGSLLWLFVCLLLKQRLYRKRFAPTAIQPHKTKENQCSLTSRSWIG